jgi:hypothetical protein
LNGIKCRPIVGDANIVSSAGVAKLERKKRDFARCMAAQPSRGRKSPLMFGKRAYWGNPSSGQ